MCGAVVRPYDGFLFRGDLCVSFVSSSYIQDKMKVIYLDEENGGFKKTFELIINEAERKKNYDAFFQTTVALTIKKNITTCFEGIVRGKISNKPLGLHGFHYDPIFIPNNANKTYAQMSTKEKNQISHRAIAMNKLKKFLEKSFN